MLVTILAIALAASGVLTEGEVQTVQTGFQFTEGPLWLPSGGLIFSDIPADAILRPDKSAFRQPSGRSNGLTLDTQGRLVAAEHENRRVSRTEADGKIVVVADRFEGKRFNSPNDVVVRSDGVIFFTDPPYGLQGGLEGPNAELNFAGVFAVMPTGAVKALVRDFVRPNGLALSADEKNLYVAECELGHIRAFDVAADGTLSNDRRLCDIPGPDGMKVDRQGNIWSSADDGIRVISPKGELLQTIAFPEQPANCGFGDADYKTLYVTARHGVYKIRTTVPGIIPGLKK